MTRLDGWRLACFRRAPVPLVSNIGSRNSPNRPRSLPTPSIRPFSKKATKRARDLQFWADAVGACIESHRRDFSATRAASLEARLKSLAEAARSTALSMEVDFLLDPDRPLLSIGL